MAESVQEELTRKFKEAWAELTEIRKAIQKHNETEKVLIERISDLNTALRPFNPNWGPPAAMLDKEPNHFNTFPEDRS